MIDGAIQCHCSQGNVKDFVLGIIFYQEYKSGTFFCLLLHLPLSATLTMTIYLLMKANNVEFVFDEILNEIWSGSINVIKKFKGYGTLNEV